VSDSRALLFLLMIILGSALLSGCAFNRQFATTTATNPTNGVVTVTQARSTTYAIGDAKNALDKTRASAGKTSSVGSAGVDQEATTGNVATNARALVELLNALKSP
jgi:ABC-type molybdate transport system substrate-binding protein